MKYSDISGLSEKELLKKSTELRGEIFEARMKNSLGQLQNPMVIREARRNVARLKTAQTAKASKPTRKQTRAVRASAKAKAAKG